MNNMKRTDSYYQEETIVEPTSGLEVYYNAQNPEFEGYVDSQYFEDLQQLLPDTPIHKKEGKNSAFTHISTPLSTDEFLLHLTAAEFILPDCEDDEGWDFTTE